MKAVRGSKRLLASLFCAFLVLTCMVASVLAAPGTSDSETLTIGVPADRIPVFYQDAETKGYNVTFLILEEEKPISTNYLGGRPW